MENYNWDDVDCPSTEFHSYSNNFDRSEFFAYKHEKHELFYQNNSLENKSESVNQDLDLENGHIASNVYIHQTNLNETKENFPVKILNYQLMPELISVNEKNIKIKSKKPLIENNNRNVPSNLLQHSWRYKPSKEEKTTLSSKTKPAPIAIKNNTKPEPPTVYKYYEIYEKKRQRQIAQLLNEEHQNRIFHSKPAPVFSKYSAKKSPEERKIQVTVPITPAVLKKSKFHDENKKQNLEDVNLKNSLPKPRDPKVLYEEPFKPKKIAHSIKSEPFHLHVEERLQKRRNYDETFKKKLEEKKQQMDEGKRRKDEELVKEFRKMTTFKARPNPFK